MSEKHIPDQRARWTSHQKQIGEQLRNYYQACTIEELPPQLLALLKKLDPELPEGQDQ
jgi:anti-sigma factor NepR-like protein